MGHERCGFWSSLFNSPAASPAWQKRFMSLGNEAHSWLHLAVVTDVHEVWI